MIHACAADTVIIVTRIISQVALHAAVPAFVA
jgi:hypothetical protein